MIRRISTYVIGIGMAVAILVGAVEVGAHSSLSPDGVRGAVLMKNDQWHARFVNEDDRDAVRRWAEGICEGLTLRQAAALFDTEPTMAAVAKEVTKGLPVSAQEAARDACEATLRRAAMRAR